MAVKLWNVHELLRDSVLEGTVCKHTLLFRTDKHNGFLLERFGGFLLKSIILRAVVILPICYVVFQNMLTLN